MRFQALLEQQAKSPVEAVVSKKENKRERGKKLREDFNDELPQWRESGRE